MRRFLPRVAAIHDDHNVRHLSISPDAVRHHVHQRNQRHHTLSNSRSPMSPFMSAASFTRRRLLLKPAPSTVQRPSHASANTFDLRELFDDNIDDAPCFPRRR